MTLTDHEKAFVDALLDERVKRLQKEYGGTDQDEITLQAALQYIEALRRKL